MPKKTFFNLPEEKRNRIMEAAINVFTKTHYGKVTIDNIVNEARIPKGSFYQYFHNKDDLYVYMFTQFSETKMNAFKKLKEEADTLDFKQFMMKFILELKKLENSDPRIEQLKQEFLNECPQDIKKTMIKNEMPKHFKIFEEVIDLYIKKGQFREDLDSKTAAYASLICISNLEYYELSEKEDIVEVLSKIIDLLFCAMKRIPKNDEKIES